MCVTSCLCPFSQQNKHDHSQAIRAPTYWVQWEGLKYHLPQRINSRRVGATYGVHKLSSNQRCFPDEKEFSECYVLDLGRIQWPLLHFISRCTCFVLSRLMSLTKWKIHEGILYFSEFEDILEKLISKLTTILSLLLFIIYSFLIYRFFLLKGGGTLETTTCANSLSFKWLKRFKMYITTLVTLSASSDFNWPLKIFNYAFIVKIYIHLAYRSTRVAIGLWFRCCAWILDAFNYLGNITESNNSRLL